LSTPVVIVGASGRMGQFASRLIENSAEFELALRVGSDGDLVELLGNHRAALALDVTHAGLGFEHGMAMLELGLRPVIGTSGVTPEEVAQLDAFARAQNLGGMVVPNFSLGMAALQAAAKSIGAEHFEAVEIIEMHHPAKHDAPSATALETARQIEECRQPHNADRVAIHSLRLPGVQARQELVFGAPGERLSLCHEVVSREAYGPGILKALRFASKADGVFHGLAAALTQ
jgi:4-hydroxy-tetrahydrodipicolinate reductase